MIILFLLSYFNLVGNTQPATIGLKLDTYSQVNSTPSLELNNQSGEQTGVQNKRGWWGNTLLKSGEYLGGVAGGAGGYLLCGYGIGVFTGKNHDNFEVVGGVVGVSFGSALGTYLVGKYIGKEKKKKYISALIGGIISEGIAGTFILFAQLIGDNIPSVAESVSYFGKSGIISCPIGGVIAYNLF